MTTSALPIGCENTMKYQTHMLNVTLGKSHWLVVVSKQLSQYRLATVTSLYSVQQLLSHAAGCNYEVIGTENQQISELKLTVGADRHCKAHKQNETSDKHGQSEDCDYVTQSQIVSQSIPAAKHHHYAQLPT